MLRVGNKITRNKTVHQSEHGVLDGAKGIKMPAVTNGMLRCVNRMWGVGAHDPEKVKVRLNKDSGNHIQSSTRGEQNCF